MVGRKRKEMKGVTKENVAESSCDISPCLVVEVGLIDDKNEISSRTLQQLSVGQFLQILPPDPWPRAECPGGL
jgi:hypothetical protein